MAHLRRAYINRYINTYINPYPRHKAHLRRETNLNEDPFSEGMLQVPSDLSITPYSCNSYISVYSNNQCMWCDAQVKTYAILQDIDEIDEEAGLTLF